MRRATIAALPLLALALLTLTPAPAARGQAPASESPPTLAGRNCGGTLLTIPGDPDEPAPILAAAGDGWAAASPVDDVPTALRQIAPALTLTPAGSPVFAWQELGGRDGGDIFVARADAPASPRKGVRADDTGLAAVDQRGPAVAMLESGRIYSIWQDRREGRGSSTSPFYDLYAAYSDDGGATWSANARVAAPSLAQPSLVEPHAIAIGGTVHLIYVGDGRSDSVFYTRNDGGAWSRPQRVDDGSIAARSRPSLTRASNGDLVAAWQDSRDGGSIYVDRLTLSAEAIGWGADVQANQAGVPAEHPSLAAAPDGTLYLAYRNSAGVFLRRSTDGGQTWLRPTAIDAGPSRANPRLAVDSAGRLHCIWCRLSGNANIMAARSGNGGASWGAAVELASSTGTAEPLDLVADSAGRVFAAWSDSLSDGSNETLYSAQWSDQRLHLPLLSR